MSKRNVSEIEKGAGYFQGLISGVMDVVRAKDVPFAAVYRLVTPSGRTTLEKMVDLAHADWQADPSAAASAKAEQPKPVDPVSFTAWIIYVQPKFEELKCRFPAHVNPDYKDRRFDPIERCKDVSRESREVVFEYVYMVCKASFGDVLAEMDSKGLRPALYEELLGFAQKYPDEQKKHPIVALGSVISVDGLGSFAGLWGDDRGRGLGLSQFCGVKYSIFQFLAVRRDR